MGRVVTANDNRTPTRRTEREKNVYTGNGNFISINFSGGICR